MGTYVVGDLHAHYDVWIDFKEKIERLDEEASFILVGDILDRGPQEKELLAWCRLNIFSGGKYQMVMGNHEYERIAFEQNTNRLRFYTNLPFYIEKKINGRRFIIVHASLPDSIVKEDGSLKELREITPHEAFDMVWSRNLKAFTAIPDAVVIHGHNPTVFEDSFRIGDFSEDKRGRIYNLGNRINIDCGLSYENLSEHRLAALRLEDMKVFYSDEL